MKNQFFASLTLLSALLPIAAQDAVKSPNLAVNGGFEDGAAPWNLPANYRVVDDVARTGRRSLKVTNNEEGVYQLATQRINARPGAQYRFTVWIKTSGLQGQESGATATMEWAGDKGWLGGAYPAGRKGDNDWFKVEGVTQPMQPDVKTVTLTLYLRRGITGTAWFDDVSVQEVMPPPMESALLWPNYRGWLRAENARQQAVVRVRPAAVLENNLTRADLTLVSRLRRDGTLLQQQETKDLRSGECDVQFSLDKQPPGRYSVEVELRGDGKTLARKSYEVTKLAPGTPWPRVAIDEYNRTLIEGQPFFPLGLYFGPHPASPDYKEHIDRIAASPFNVIMPYGINSGSLENVRGYLDYLAQKNVKIIYSVKDIYAGTSHFREPLFGQRGEVPIVDNIVKNFREHPALLAWYINDEIPLTGMRERLEARQQLLRELDAGHPTWSVLFQVDEIFGYLDTADVVGTDPYPLPGRSVNLAGEWTQKTAAASSGLRPLWQVPQAHDPANYNPGNGRAPTRDEMRVMTYLCLIHGARGLVFYSYFDLQRDKLGFEKRWADMAAIGDEVKALFPALLSTNRPAPAKVTASLPDVQSTTLRDEEGNVYVLLANPANAAAEVSVSWPKAGRIELIENGTRRRVAEPGTATKLTLPPLGATTVMVKAKG